MIRSLNWEQAVGAACALANKLSGRGVWVSGCGARIGHVGYHEFVAGFDVAEWVLDWFGFGGSTFGVESVSLECAERSLRYLNAGDTYDVTVCREGRRAFFAGSWGDWLEEAERDYDTENDTCGCGYCGKRTPIVGDDWSSTRCESCGRNVSTGDVMPEVAEVDDDDT